MADKYRATFHQGRPLPQRNPLETLASFDRTAAPQAPADRMHYESPGTPPWVAPDELPPLWPIAVVAGLCGLAVLGVITGVWVWLA